jgi:hypothetical protein
MTPDETLRDHVEWALGLINEGRGSDQIATRLAEGFLEAVPAEQFLGIAETQLRPLGPFTVEGTVEATDTSTTLALRGRDDVAFSLLIAIEPTAPHRIAGLLVRPAALAVASWDELSAKLGSLASEVGFAAAEVLDGDCRLVHGAEPDRPLALGSAFKLYVLGALADEVSAGRADWNESVELRDELRVHSSAVFLETPAGTEVSLRDLAGPMIAVSDNTATDHVMDRVGRDAIEAQQRVLGMASPELNHPFLTTHEMSMLKWGSSEETRASFLAGDHAHKLQVLAALPRVPATLDALTASAGPVAVDSLEWFASPLDLCRAHARLQTKGPEVRAILSENPGTRFDPSKWSYVAFKGGSEPGVLCFAWLAKRHDNRVFAVALALRDHEREIDTMNALSAVEAAFHLLLDEA